MNSIIDLSLKVQKLPSAKKDLFDTFFTVRALTGRLKVPASMTAWATKQFGSVKAVEEQAIVTITNNFTYHTTGFNALRANRPLSTKETVDLEEYMAHDVFATPLKGTPADTFGRVKGKYCITASNVAKYDGVHGLVIFNTFNPLAFTKMQLRDYLQTAMTWLEKAHRANPHAFFPVIQWNCLWKSGASLAHGHMQTLLLESPPGTMNILNHTVHTFSQVFDTTYFDGLFQAHKDVGLALEHKGVRVLSELTPPKEKGVLLFTKKYSTAFSDTLFEVLQAQIALGVQSFNVFITLPPFKPYDWHLPVMAHVVDRDKLTNKTTDVGALELLWNHSIVSSDPYKVHSAIKKRLAKR